MFPKKKVQYKIDEINYQKEQLNLDLQFMRSIFRGYQIQRVRQKLSFHAFMKNETIIELWLKQIKKSFKFLKETNQIEANKDIDEL